jgi:glycine/D-amino acid oxidase-like deaminating enzyme
MTDFQYKTVSMNNVFNVAVIGCGIFGAEIALKASACGLSVKVLEAKSDILAGASMNNQNRLHLGFHYPRDLETGQQSIRGFDAFRQNYADCIQGDFPNAYFIANNGSMTNPASYIQFCSELGVPFQEIEAKDFCVPVRGADYGILCEEVVYDCTLLRDLVKQKLRQQQVEVSLGERVNTLVKQGGRYRLETLNQTTIFADVVINATYGDINRLTEGLGHVVNENLYEYTAVPIIKMAMPRVGVTIMDGPFMTVLPHGKSDNFLLYNVAQSVVASNVAKLLDPSWLSPETAPFAGVNKSDFFNKMVSLCSDYMPAIKNAELIGFLEGPRMVLAKKDASDARPSLLTNYEGGYFSVFSGKIDHSIWVAEDLMGLLKTKFCL